MKDINKIIENINSVMKGKEDVVKLMLTAIISGGHILIEDVPGVGKTTFANAFAKTFDCSFSRIQFTPDTMPGDVIGSSVYNFETHKFEYIEGAIMGNIVLADEINRTSPKTQACLLEAMEEGMVTVDGVSHNLPYPFIIIATQNPVMQRGTYYLPESQLDRFMMKLSIGYPDLISSIDIVKENMKQRKVNSLSKVTDINSLKQIIEEVKDVKIKDELIKYAAECVELTRTHENVSLGASPRALIAWIKAAKGYAYISGRDYVVPDDLKILAHPVLDHRIIVNTSFDGTGEDAHKVVSEILGKVMIPIG